MLYFTDVKLDYQDLSTRDLYDDIDLQKYDIVDAQYRAVPGYTGNPDICALPEALSPQETLRSIYIPPVLQDDDWTTGSLSQQLLKVSTLRQVRIPLMFQSELEHKIIELCMQSYSCRRLALTDHPVLTKIHSDDYSVSILSNTGWMQGSGPCGSMFGAAGTGKTAALGIALKRIPRAIRHTFPEGHYIQIPIVALTAYSASNIRALLFDFARRIDDILDSGNMHMTAIGRHSGNIGQMSEQVIRWINLYHVGAIVIDEIQFIDTNPNSSRSIENLITITECTQVGLFVSGNAEALAGWKNIPRLVRRLERTPIITNEQCFSNHMRVVIGMLWKRTVFSEQYPITEELIDTIIAETAGSIDMISLLLSIMQSEWLVNNEKIRVLHNRPASDAVKNAIINKTKAAEVTPSFIKRIAGRYLQRMKELFESKLDGDAKKYEEERTRLDNLVHDTAATQAAKENAQALQEFVDDYKAGYDHVEKLQMVVNAITDTDIAGKFTEKQIQMAFTFAETTVAGFKKASNREMIRETLKILEQRARKNDQRRKNKIKQEDHKAETLLAELQESMHGEIK